MSWFWSLLHGRRLAEFAGFKALLSCCLVLMAPGAALSAGPLVSVCQQATDSEKFVPPQPQFTVAQIAELQRVAQEIIKHTEPRDVLIFVGRTPLWIAHVLEMSGADRRIYNVAFSGRPYETNQSIPTAAELAAFYSYLEALGLDPRELARTQGRIWLIDMLATGRGMRAFLRVLTDWIRHFRLGSGVVEALLKDKIKILNLASADAARAALPRRFGFTHSYSNLIMADETLIPLSNAPDHWSLGVYYPHKLWPQVNPLAQAPHPQALKLLEQLEVKL